jgi:N-acetylmuramic acid 6-phosphate etherase
MASMPDDFLTEAVLESTRDLDRRSTREVLDAIHTEDRYAVEAIGEVLPEVERAVDVLVLVLQGGGTWFNVGAGTSGRVGVLDASEIPPTFGYPPERVQGVMAGGMAALVQAVEGAEDQASDARRALRDRELMPGDAVVAISASGRTPFALGALEVARTVGARRIAVTCDPNSPLAQAAEVAISPKVGPEVIAGSTRMKGGLAQKMVLHLLSTTVMVRLGRVEGNLMTNLHPVSRKLRRRALRIVMSLTNMDEAAARASLDDHHGSVHDAVQAARKRGAQ